MNSSSMYISVCVGLVLFCSVYIAKRKIIREIAAALKKNRLVDIFLQESYQGIKVFITFANDYKAVIVSD
ncbi:MAG: hypothetical protein KIG40_07935 [Bacteroidaceae bacterium]|nr:hypothetical protein [Bacteroidaceae bacterium]